MIYWLWLPFIITSQTSGGVDGSDSLASCAERGNGRRWSREMSSTVSIDLSFPSYSQATVTKQIPLGSNLYTLNGTREGRINPHIQYPAMALWYMYINRLQVDLFVASNCLVEIHFVALPSIIHVHL